MKTKSTRINVPSSNKLLMLPVFIIFLLTTSCGGLGVIFGGGVQSYTGKYTIELSRSTSDILDVVADVGKSMSLNISSMDASRGYIAFSTRSSTGATMLVGSTNRQSISITSSTSGKKLKIDVMVVGNFNAGTKEAGDKLFHDFESRLLEKIQ